MKGWIRYVELFLLTVIAVVLVIDRFGSTNHKESSSEPQGVINLVQWTEASGGNDHWYGVINKELFWREAVEIAEALSFNGGAGYLATITTPAENNFVRKRVISQTHQPSILDAFWLGANLQDGEWHWLSGEPFVYQNWSMYEPNNLKNETALSMWGPNNWDDRRLPGQWNNLLPDNSVNKLHRTWSVIEWGAFEMDAEPYRLDTLVNLRQWRKVIGGNDHWYAILAIDTFFEDADEIATSLKHNGVSGNLASIGSEAENMFISQQVIGEFHQPCTTDQYWLGGMDQDGKWKWLDGTPWEYTNWSPREPNNQGMETALSMWGPSATIKGRRSGAWNNCPPNQSASELAHFFAIIEFPPR